MNDLQIPSDRIEIEALRSEYCDALMMGDYDRFAALFTHDAIYRIPDANVQQIGREAIRIGIEQMASRWEFFVQTTHPGFLQLDRDAASGRAYTCELGRLRDGTSILNYALFHDRYQRTPHGWKFAERIYEIKYFDTAPLPGSPHVTWATAEPPAGSKLSA